MRTKLTAFALLAILCLSSALTSCASALLAPKELPELYQPPVLRLPAGTPVQTQDGPYRPPLNEVWHSDARFRQLEQENLNLTAALAQVRARGN